MATKDPAVTKQLAEMRSRFEKAKEESKKAPSSTTLPVGKHECKLSSCRVPSTSKGPQFIFEWTCIAEGENQGLKAVIWRGLDTDEKFVWALRDLRTLGEDVDDLESPEQLLQIAERLTERAPRARISIVQNGQYLNAYLDKLLSDDTEVEEVAGEIPEEFEDTGELPDDGKEPEASSMSLEVGDPVKYVLNRKPSTGKVKEILNDESIKVTDDKTKKVVELNLVTHQVEGLVVAD